MADQIPEDVRESIVDLYLAGKRTADITALTGVARSSIYNVLHQEGVKPTRQRGAAPRTTVRLEAVRHDGDGQNPGAHQLALSNERFTLIRAQQQQMIEMLARIITMLERIEQR